MRKVGIYAIRNAEDGKVYVGSSVNIKHRWSLHRSQLRGGKHANTHLQNAWDLFGEDAFLFEILEVTDQATLIEREQFYLDALRAFDRHRGYNICQKAYSTYGREFSAESRAKISAATTGKPKGPWSDDLRKRASDARKGKPKSPEHRAAIKAAHVARAARLRLAAEA